MDRVSAAYRRLGISRGASFTEITRAYRTLAKKYHPDSNPQDQQSSHQMMMEINEAYAVVKESLKQARYDAYDHAYETAHRTTHQAAYRRTAERYMDLAAMYAQMQRQAEEKRRRAEEQMRREREALNRYWERMLKERQKEESDSQSYGVIMENVSILIAYFYQENLYNPVFRLRPYGRLLFDKFVQKYREFMRRCRAYADSLSSDLYRRRARQVHDFLEAFLEDVRDVDHAGLEQRAFAAGQFEKAFRNSDRLIDGLFTDESMSRDDEKRLLRETLSMFDEFCRSYPNSDLIPHAQGRVEVLERLYRAFMAE